MRVALIRPRCDSDFLEPCEPLGIELLAAALERNGFTAEIFDRELDGPGLRELDGPGLRERLAAFSPELAALSVMTAESVADAQRLALFVRERIPNAALVVGGLYATTCPARAQAQFPAGTRFLYGEGEASLPRLCRALSGEPDGPLTPEYLAPEQWPWADRRRMDAYIAMGAPISIRSARGCPGACAFCATPCLPPPLNRWAGRPVDDVAGEMESLCARFSPPVFNFVDDDFGSLGRIEALVDRLDRRGVRAAFSLQLRGPALYGRSDLPAVLARLRAGGLSRIFVGLESLSADTLAWFGKSLEPDRVLSALSTARVQGVETHIGYILWHSLSTPDSVRAESVALRNSGFFTVKTAMSRLVLFPGTELYRSLGARTHHAAWAPLSPGSDELYRRVETLIAPLYKRWITGAAALPRLACLAHLTGDRRPVNSVNAALERLDALAFSALLEPQGADKAEIIRVADEVGGELHAHCRAGLVAR